MCILIPKKNRFVSRYIDTKCTFVKWSLKLFLSLIRWTLYKVFSYYHPK